MNKNIIVISGPENSGKSTTVRMIVQQLRPFCDNRDNSDIKWPKHDFVNSTVPIRGAREILHELIINGKIVGLTSFGDSVEIIKRKFETLVDDWHSNYIVCCCRDEGPTREYIEESYGDKILEWHTLPQEKDFERRKQNEIVCAAKVVNKITNKVIPQTHMSIAYLLKDLDKRKQWLVQSFEEICNLLSQINSDERFTILPYDREIFKSANFKDDAERLSALSNVFITKSAEHCYIDLVKQYNGKVPASQLENLYKYKISDDVLKKINDEISHSNDIPILGACCLLSFEDSVLYSLYMHFFEKKGDIILSEWTINAYGYITAFLYTKEAYNVTIFSSYSQYQKEIKAFIDSLGMCNKRIDDIQHILLMIGCASKYEYYKLPLQWADYTFEQYAKTYQDVFFKTIEIRNIVRSSLFYKSN